MSRTKEGPVFLLLVIFALFALGTQLGKSVPSARHVDSAVAWKYLQSAAAVERPPRAVLHAKHLSFSLTAPRRWVIDQDTHEFPGREALIYATGTDWKTSVTKMWVFTTPTQGKKATPMFPSDEQIKTAHGKHVLIRYSRASTVVSATTVAQLAAGTPSADAYITEGHEFVEVVLQTDDAHFEDAKNTFKAIVNTYQKLK
jgi:hypothetical protein